ncbi:hypothetical protein [Photobacterium angustum]|uniref:hypothetical protein n=1 Tax=Photobacterium angustum TaxID=661 RepID=UPI0011B25A92|nr:hypothetical protein [Photobacterium angustum]
MSKKTILNSVLITILFISAIAGHLERIMNSETKTDRNFNAQRKVMSREDLYKFRYQKSPIKCDYNGYYRLAITPKKEDKHGGRVKTQYYSEYTDHNNKKHYTRLSIVSIYDDENNVGFRLKGQTADRNYRQDVSYYINNGILELKINDLRDQLNKTVLTSPRSICKKLSLI